MDADSPVSTIIIVAGGTGGHIYPALAVALQLQQRGYQIHWLGTERGLESRVVPTAGLKIHFLRVQGLRGKGLMASLQGALLALWAVLQALRCVYQLHPVVVLGMGGYVAGPVGLACRLLGKPLLIHEQNSVAGTTNRILSRFARRVLTAYPAAFDETVDATLVGNPVRAELLQLGARAHYDYDGRRPLQLLVIGGSLGARAINEVVPQALSLLPSSCQVLVRHQTGTAHADSVRSDYLGTAEVKVEVLPYIEDMGAAYLWADLVLCRAGALTLAELTIMGRPSILVPLPHSIDNHQARNADWLVQAGAALLLPQAEMNPKSLAKLLGQLTVSPTRLVALAHAASHAARADATTAVADICEEVRLER